MAETLELRRRFPEILVAITEDQNRVGMAKKLLRAEHAEWLARQTPALPGLEDGLPGLVVAAALGTGRPRMARDGAGLPDGVAPLPFGLPSGGGGAAGRPSVRVCD